MIAAAPADDVVDVALVEMVGALTMSPTVH